MHEKGANMARAIYNDTVVAEIIERSPRHRTPDGREWPIFEAVPLERVSARVTE